MEVVRVRDNEDQPYLEAATVLGGAGSGFDRVHMCPAKDRSASRADSLAVFYMTNMIPQAPACNQKAWERLEDYCRRLAKEGKVLSIACGPAGQGGTGLHGHEKEIGKGRIKVTVPRYVWKVVLVLPREDAEPRKNTRVIAVIMPNDQSVDFNWPKYRVTTSAVWCPATDVSTVISAPSRARDSGREYAARFAATNWSRRRPSRNAGPARS